jgi:oligopeptide/dipeptide ABC transporter ATP-binding protein
MLELRDVHVGYPLRRGVFDTLRGRPRRQIHAVDSVTLSLDKGSFLALVGESGSGKTTLARSLVGLVPIDSGSVWLEGVDITPISAAKVRSIRTHIQMIYQDPYESLDPRMRVRDIVEETLRIHHTARGAIRAARIDDALERVGLTPDRFLARYPHELSGGQRQRVAIASALVLAPEILIADEPVSMLDVSYRVSVLRLLDSLRRDLGMSVIMITHDLSTAALFADRIAVMYRGRIVEEGASTEVIDRPLHPYTKALIDAVPRTRRTDRVRRHAQIGEVSDSADMPSGCRFHPRCPVAEPQCPTLDPSLWVDLGVPTHRAACVHVSGAPGQVRLEEG